MVGGRCQARRCGEVEGRAQAGEEYWPVVAGVSRKIVNIDWLEVDEGDLPVLCTSDGAEKNGLTYLLSVDCYFHRIL